MKADAGGSTHLEGSHSPYLQDHKKDLVCWYPWGDEALEKARSEGKLLFISIGYLSCHWCHVMERESFMDEGMARLINDNFIAILIDREERPDLDSHFMDICVSSTGSGGWPMTIMMTPDKVVVFAATYIPKSSRGGMIGLMELLPMVIKAWRDRSPLLMDARGAPNYGNEIVAANPSTVEGVGLMKGAFESLSSSFDREFGGFGSGPKFPAVQRLGFLLRYWKRFNSTEALQMVETTLMAMRKGGIFDQLGGGFHRYAVDREWLLPHFEKMMYDQALLGYIYAEAYQATGNELYATVVNEIFNFVFTEMKSPDGAFFTAIDADSEGEEGAFYLWDRSELERILPTKLLASAKVAFGTAEVAVGGGKPESVLYLADSPEAIAGRLNLTTEELKRTILDITKRLLAIRSERIRPRTDTKVLSDINGMAIAFLSKAYSAIGDFRYARAARGCADFVMAKLVAEDGALYHVYADNTATINGLLDDYANLCWGLRELYEATFEKRYLDEAIRLLDFSIKHFFDREGGGFYNIPDFSADRAFMKKELYDGAVPSGNSIHALNLVHIARMTDRESHLKALESTFSWAKSIAVMDPASYTGFLQAVDAELGPLYRVVLTGPKRRVGQMAEALRRRYLPNKMLLYKPREGRLEFAPFTDVMEAGGEEPIARVCTDTLCKRPTGDLGEMFQQLGI
ncbi:MAG: thioredoxin domain-containing protein [Nitrososphaerota archaeon]|nr:thioredoxin domain-containing protein [Nitrososphaerota archaeon]